MDTHVTSSLIAEIPVTQSVRDKLWLQNEGYLVHPKYLVKHFLNQVKKGANHDRPQ